MEFPDVKSTVIESRMLTIVRLIDKHMEDIQRLEKEFQELEEELQQEDDV